MSKLREKHNPVEGSLGNDLLSGHDDHEDRIGELEDGHGDHEGRIRALEEDNKRLKAERNGARRSAGIWKSKMKS